MMSQGWMGSDYTNDDILKESSVVNDYTHEIKKRKSCAGRTCYKVILKAREIQILYGNDRYGGSTKRNLLF